MAALARLHGAFGITGAQDVSIVNAASLVSSNLERIGAENPSRDVRAELSSSMSSKGVSDRARARSRSRERNQPDERRRSREHGDPPSRREVGDEGRKSSREQFHRDSGRHARDAGSRADRRSYNDGTRGR